MTQHFDEGQKRERALQQEVLTYLQQHGPENCDALYSRFTLASEVSVASVLEDLKDGGHITVTNHDNLMIATITKSGLNRV